MARKPVLLTPRFDARNFQIVINGAGRATLYVNCHSYTKVC